MTTSSSENYPVNIESMKGAFNSWEVDISVGARDISKSANTKCVLFTQELGSPDFTEFGETETISNNLESGFTEMFRMSYFSEEEQTLKFVLYNVSGNSKTDLGEVTCSLKNIVTNGKLERQLMRKGKEGNFGSLILHAITVGDCKNEVTFKCRAERLPKMDTFGSADPYLIVSREIQLKEGGQDFVPVCRTEIVERSLAPVWRPITVSVEKLCGNNYSNRIRVECFDWDKHSKDDDIGSFDTDLKAIIGGNISQKLGKRSKDRGTVIISSGKIERKFSFYDYVEGATRLKFSIAIDFTESNGKQDNPSSRHFIDESGKIANIYQKIMTLINDTIAIYDPENSVRAYGFGAKLKPTETMTPIFNFHQKGEPYNGITNVLDDYLNWSQTITLAGPTNHAPVINKANELAEKQKDGRLYIVIIIITDDSPHDIAETKDAIAKAATLPVSIIFVGVGEKDFSDMDEVIRPIGTDVRDVATFVKIEDHLDQQKMFISESQCRHAIFSKIPDQLVSWMTLKTTQPRADSPSASGIECSEKP